MAKSVTAFSTKMKNPEQLSHHRVAGGIPLLTQRDAMGPRDPWRQAARRVPDAAQPVHFRNHWVPQPGGPHRRAPARADKE